MHLGGTELPTSRTTTHPLWCQCDRSKLYRTAGKSGTFPAAPSGSLPPGGPATRQRQRRWDLRARGVSLSCRRTPDLHACLADLFHLGLGFGLGSDHVFGMRMRVPQRAQGRARSQVVHAARQHSLLHAHLPALGKETLHESELLENADRGKRCGKGFGPASGRVLALPSLSSLSVAMPPGSVGAERIEPATAAGARDPGAFTIETSFAPVGRIRTRWARVIETTLFYSKWMVLT